MISRQRACCSALHVADRRLDDRPVVIDLRPEGVVEWETDHLALFRGDRLVEPRDGGLGGCPRGRAYLGRSRRGSGPPEEGNRRGERAGADGFDKVAPRYRGTERALDSRRFPVVDLCHGSQSPCPGCDLGEGRRTTDQKEEIFGLNREPKRRTLLQSQAQAKPGWWPTSTGCGDFQGLPVSVHQPSPRARSWQARAASIGFHK